MLRITKQEIVRSAAKHFRERGYLAVSIQEIATTAKFQRGPSINSSHPRMNYLPKFSMSVSRIISQGLMN